LPIGWFSNCLVIGHIPWAKHRVMTRGLVMRGYAPAHGQRLTAMLPTIQSGDSGCACFVGPHFNKSDARALACFHMPVDQCASHGAMDFEELLKGGAVDRIRQISDLDEAFHFIPRRKRIDAIPFKSARLFLAARSLHSMFRLRH
jgi:hypothetical protein